MTKALMENINPYLSFAREMRRLCKEKPAYEQGIKDGVVSLRFLPRHSPFPKHLKKEQPKPVETDYEVRCDCGYTGFRYDCLHGTCPSCGDRVRRTPDNAADCGT